MGKVYIKTINGLKYRYERLSSKRVGDKVITKDKCLGAVTPVVNKLDRLPKKRKRHYETMWQGRVLSASGIVDELREKDGIKISETTVRNWMKKNHVARMPYTDDARREAMGEAMERRASKKRVGETKTELRFRVLLEERRVTPKQTAAIGKGTGLNKKMVDRLWEKRG